METFGGGRCGDTHNLCARWIWMFRRHATVGLSSGKQCRCLASRRTGGPYSWYGQRKSSQISFLVILFVAQVLHVATPTDPCVQLLPWPFFQVFPFDSTLSIQLLLGFPLQRSPWGGSTSCFFPVEDSSMWVRSTSISAGATRASLEKRDVSCTCRHSGWDTLTSGL